MENLALRHQLAVLHRQAHKPRARGTDRLLWVVLKGWWPNWRAALILFQPETVFGWQRAGFRMFWRWKSRHCGGRPRKDAALIQLIRRMWAVNPVWGSPRTGLNPLITADTGRLFRAGLRRPNMKVARQGRLSVPCAKSDCYPRGSACLVRFFSCSAHVWVHFANYSLQHRFMRTGLAANWSGSGDSVDCRVAGRGIRFPF
jgi:hypothetical protein